MNEDLKTENEKLRKRVLELENNEHIANKKIKKRKIRSFDFSRYKMRHIAIKFCYLGWSYSGLVTQLNVPNTVLESVYQALEMCRMIENRDNCNIIACGRTDKGVSGFQQVISLPVRSNLATGKGILPDTGVNINLRKDPCDKEIDFVFLLNKVLPTDIRALRWAPVDLDFSARFSCKSRAYKYLLPKSNLSLEKMKEGGKKLLGEHDFRNFCSMQIKQGNKNYVRTILDFSIEPLDKDQKDDMYNIYAINIKATAFLYHQIRCIVSVLIMIGQEVENPDIIDKLLDIEGFGGSGKPQYAMASDLPLVFYEASYGNIDWQVSKEAVNDYTRQIEGMWTSYKMKESILRLYLTEIESNNLEMLERDPLINSLCEDSRIKSRRSLINRVREPTLEQRIASDNLKRSNKLKEEEGMMSC